MAATGILIEGLDAPPTPPAPPIGGCNPLPTPTTPGDATQQSSTDQAKQPPGNFTDSVNADVFDKLLIIFNDVVTDSEIESYDKWTIPHTDGSEIKAWSQCTDEGYQFTLEQWGETVLSLLRKLTWVITMTPILAIMSMDFPVGKSYRISVRNILRKIQRIIDGNKGTYLKGSEQLWCPQSLIEGQAKIQSLQRLLLTHTKIKLKNEDLLELLTLQMKQLKLWLTEEWARKFERKDPMLPSNVAAKLAAEEVTLGLASKMVQHCITSKEWERNAYIAAKNESSVAIKALKWRIAELRQQMQRKEMELADMMAHTASIGSFLLIRG